MSDSYGNMVVGFSGDFKGNKEKIAEYFNEHFINTDVKINDDGQIVIVSDLDQGQILYPSLDFGGEKSLEDEVVEELREFIDEGVLYISTTSTDKCIGNVFEYLKISNDEWEVYKFQLSMGYEPYFNRYLSNGNKDEDLVGST